MEVKTFTQDLDGQMVAYSSETNFFVDIGKGSKGGYKSLHVVKGNLSCAVGWYSAINIGNGYKKRLRMEGKVLARKCS
jgi:hypothetical protein